MTPENVQHNNYSLRKAITKTAVVIQLSKPLGHGDDTSHVPLLASYHTTPMSQRKELWLWSVMKPDSPVHTGMLSELRLS